MVPGQAIGAAHPTTGVLRVISCDSLLNRDDLFFGCGERLGTLVYQGNIGNGI